MNADGRRWKRRILKILVQREHFCSFRDQTAVLAHPFFPINVHLRSSAVHSHPIQSPLSLMDAPCSGVRERCFETFFIPFTCDKLTEWLHLDVTRSSCELVTSKIAVEFSGRSASLPCTYLDRYGSLHYSINAIPHFL